MTTEVEGSVPVFKVIYKSSATSPIVILEYDMDASATTTFENEIFSVNNKAVLTHADLTMDVNHVISQAFGSQADDSSSAHTLNVDITSPTFTDVNLRYAARRDGTSASVSTPSAGFLGFQFNGRVPSQMTARFYGRYPSTPDVDVDIMVVRSSPKDADKMSMQIAYNMEAPKAMLSELKMKLPSIFSAFTTFADKYQITNSVEAVKAFVTKQFNDAYNVAMNYDDQLSQLSIFFRNVIVQYQKTVQVFLDAVIKVLRETKFKLPGSDELTTIPEVLKKLTSSIAAMLEATLQMIFDNMEVFYNFFVETISKVKVRMPVGDAITGGQIIDQVKAAFKLISAELVDFIKNMESLDTMLEKINETVKAIVDKTQELIDSISSDFLDAVFIKVNEFYRNLVTGIMRTAERFPILNVENLSRRCEQVIDNLIFVISQFNDAVYGFLQQASAQAQAYMKVTDGKLEVDLPFPFQQ
ncbi:apolipoprotein B-100-like [Stegastes partitus]|uniref:Apolipoprotein B-100-like n=1 Tax=Stegastes partitus TaxID=144197 RepID=A0A9Y4K3C3_9TELE|nr:PREDICTED: apolipoprotein B-100-like [Stegastes partitus]